jgi:hypothetical protein
MTNINLTTGTMDTNDNLDGWVITSDTASYIITDDPEYGDLNVYMYKGDRITVDGDVWRGNRPVANIA